MNSDVRKNNDENRTEMRPTVGEHQLATHQNAGVSNGELQYTTSAEDAVVSSVPGPDASGRPAVPPPNELVLPSDTPSVLRDVEHEDFPDAPSAADKSENLTDVEVHAGTLLDPEGLESNISDEETQSDAIGAWFSEWDEKQMEESKYAGDVKGRSYRVLLTIKLLTRMDGEDTHWQDHC